MVGGGFVKDWVELPQFVNAPNWFVVFPVGVVPNLVVGSQFGVSPK